MKGKTTKTINGVNYYSGKDLFKTMIDTMGGCKKDCANCLLYIDEDNICWYELDKIRSEMLKERKQNKL